MRICVHCCNASVPKDFYDEMYVVLLFLVSFSLRFIFLVSKDVIPLRTTSACSSVKVHFPDDSLLMDH